MNECCAKTCPASTGYECTLIKSHKGQIHVAVATGDEVCAVWTGEQILFHRDI